MAMAIESVRGGSYIWLCPWKVYVEIAIYKAMSIEMYVEIAIYKAIAI